jgi:hypothetical protein
MSARKRMPNAGVRPVSIALFVVSLLACSEGSHGPPSDKDGGVDASPCHGSPYDCPYCGVEPGQLVDICSCPGCALSTQTGCLGTPSCVIAITLPDGGTADGGTVPRPCGYGPYSCSSLATSQRCAAQTGCAWDTWSVCFGTPTPCDQLTNRNDCLSQPGCNWL